MNPHEHQPRLADYFLTRRDFLARSGMGLGGLGLATLLSQTGVLVGEPALSTNPLAPRQPHFPAKAKRVIHFFMQVGPSQVDTFDPKPMLTKYDGKSIKGVSKHAQNEGAAFGSPFKFKPYGKSGVEVSEVFEKTAAWVDHMCVVRGMFTETPSHENAMLLMNCGNSRLPRPSLGSWITYGLGSENQNLPGYIAMMPHGRPLQGDQNWQSAFLPGIYQGNFVDTKDTQVEKLIEFIRNNAESLPEQRRQLDLLQRLNAEHARKRANESQLEARIQSFEGAFRMQLEASDAFDISKEPESVRKRYGDGVQARQILIARRLLERGVRFVQVWQAAWDHHSLIATGLKDAASQIDQPIAALFQDLKERGLLDDTLLLWAGEFGRTPVMDLNQNVDQTKGKGRDHNHRGFSAWLGGGAVKGGTTYGATDEFGFAAVENKVDIADLHATILHLLGFDHTKLTYRHAGRDFRLTDIKGEVVKGVLA
ncbi:MAG: DUF1501 domain-containing protein [Verrucomicrobia bacterium]|nr:DUF1501 domain-containing protein [Verrucomicrobiota bacterium]